MPEHMDRAARAAAGDVNLRRAMSRPVEVIAREVVMSSTGFTSAWEFGHNVDGEALHAELRRALGISDDEWRDSMSR